MDLDIMLEKIRLLMTKEKLNIRGLSDTTGINYSTLRDFLAGKTSKVDTSKLSAIAKALKCDVEYLANDNIKEFIPFSEQDKKLYYLDEETAEYAQGLARDKDLKMLFKATRKVSKEDMQLVYTIINKFKSDTE